MLHMVNGGGNAGFWRAQNTAPSGNLSPFLEGERALPPPVFAGGESADRKTVAGMVGRSGRVEIFNRAWQA